MRSRTRWGALLASGLIGIGLVGTAVPAGAAEQGAGAAQGSTPGNLTGISSDGDTYTISTDSDAKLRVRFYDDDMFRIRMAPGGKFTDPANSDPQDPSAPDADIVVGHDYNGAGSHVSDKGDYRLISTGKAALRVYEGPLRFALYGPDNQRG